MDREKTLNELYENMHKIVRPEIQLKSFDTWKATMTRFTDTELSKMLGELKKLLK